ncbi:hypothetical protein ABEB36_015067 [Hypothenemus hampei]|uniref:BESS domain-containing protein n=1 Tax=Hypothenemus hampei TaxID=57062 RepID=A0ABD1E0D4_HYPHA
MEQKKRENFDSWMKAIKKQKEQKKSGTCTKPSRLYVYHEQILFLKKVTDLAISHESTNNFNETEPEDVGAEVTTGSAPSQQTDRESNQPAFTPSSTSTKRRKSSFNEVDVKMVRFIDQQINLSKISKEKDDENRHLTFFQSLLPSLSSFDEDETLEFQSGSTLLQNMRPKKRKVANNHNMPSRTLTNYYNNWQYQDYYSQQQPQTNSIVATPMTNLHTAEPSPSTPSSITSLDSIMDLDACNF